MENEIDQPDVATEAEPEEVTPETELAETTDWEAEAKKARGIAQRALTKLKKLGEKKVVVDAPKEPVKEVAPKTGEIGEAVYDFFDLKGYTDQDQQQVFVSIMKKTGMSHREVVKDEYALAKVKAIQEAKEVKAAMPKSTKRGDSGADTSLEVAIAKYEQSGYKELPTDFNLRRQVVNAMRKRADTNKPNWG